MILDAGGEGPSHHAAMEQFARAYWYPVYAFIRRKGSDHEAAEDLTRKNRRMTLSFAFNYGGRAELVDAVQRIIEDRVPANKIDDRLISKYLYAPDMPDPDLMIRTSGEYRTSNFLLWQLAYSELVFTDVLWPDFRRKDLFDAVKEFQARERRFGGVEAANTAGS